MIISEISIKGFKSYGNNEQVIKLNTESGELILLLGKNGNGKSSLIESVEYLLYGKVRSNKAKKWSKLSSLPNRINGELLNKIKFQAKGTDVEIKRGIGPSVLELWENGILNDRAGKANIDDVIENYIEMDIESFKSFISMSINDFKNFISLTNEEKQLLLDKLFNLEVINVLNTILKELNKNNKQRLISLDAEISTLEESIDSIRRSIEKSKVKALENKTQEIEDIKASMEGQKGEYTQIKEKLGKIAGKEEELSDLMDTDKRAYQNTLHEVKTIQKELDLYDQGNCPTCQTPFNSEHFTNLRSSLEEKKKSVEAIKIEQETNLRALKEKVNKLDSIKETAQKTFQELTFNLKSQKAQLDKLTQQMDLFNSAPIEETNEFEKTLDDLKVKKDISSENQTLHKEKELYYKEITKILGEDGVKKEIITGLIKPINRFVGENVKKMMLPFEVTIDDTFTATIKHLGNPVDHDSLSTGELKKINICFLVAYLKLIKTKKHINILFLDEVFSSIDLEGISDILNLLRSFAQEYKVNIFVVHHAMLEQENFDRIIKIEKDIFSTIVEVALNE